MAYDPVRKKVVLFGGLGTNGYQNDTWTFDGTNWSKVQTASAPPARTSAQMAYDIVTKKVVLFGGYNGVNYLGDTWLWDGATSTWTKATPTRSPKPVTGPSLFTDPVSGHVDNFGGFDGMFYQLTMWSWTGTTWQNLNPPNVPTARSLAAVGVNFATKSVVMFDGLGDVNPYNTWTWDGSNWTQQSPPTQPESLYGAGGAFDAKLKGVVIFGGGHAGVDVNDTWGWTGSDWVQLTPAQSPVAREGEGMVWDAAQGHILIFGGESGNGAAYYNDTWALLP
jgi:hypothetical protein